MDVTVDGGPAGIHLHLPGLHRAEGFFFVTFAIGEEDGFTDELMFHGNSIFVALSD